jgi:hypothetical protein
MRSFLIVMAALGSVTACSGDGTQPTAAPTTHVTESTRLTEAELDGRPRTEAELRYLDKVSPSGVATLELLVQGYDLCGTFEDRPEDSREALTAEWASATSVDQATARLVGAAASSDLCP